MATNSLWTANQVTTVNTSSYGIKAEAEIDFSKYTIANATDTIKCLSVPKGAHVTSVGLYMKTVTTTAADVDTVGDGDNPDGYIATDFVMDTATNVAHSLPADEFPVLGGKTYEADDTIDIVLKTAIPTDGVLVVWAVYTMVDAIVAA